LAGRSRVTVRIPSFSSIREASGELMQAQSFIRRQPGGDEAARDAAVRLSL
jgi:hypothetical protein